MKVQIEFDIDNSAFSMDDGSKDPGAIASVLDYLSGKFASLPEVDSRVEIRIRDSNGNRIGQARIIKKG